MTQHDVVIINLPKMHPHYLPAAPAILQGCCEHLGISSKFLDFNLSFVKICRDLGIDYQQDLVGIEHDTVSDPVMQHIIEDFVVDCVKNITQYQPKIIAISLFSYYGQYFGQCIAGILREVIPSALIIMGGSGIKNAMNDRPEFVENLKSQGIIDHFIDGDAEQQWYDFLVKNCDVTAPAADSFDGLVIPYLPCYKDYVISDYESFLNNDKTQIWIPVTGSRGCVRKCDFCEIHQHWKFVQRPAKHIADEIKKIVSTVSNPHLHFTDSLINGNLKEFNVLVDTLTEIQQQHQFSWGGQFIVRSPDQFGQDRWSRMKLAGVNKLEIGVETGSESLRFAMKKPFTNQDLDFVMGNLRQYNISAAFLFMIGHPFETEEDFKSTLDMLENYQEYRDIVSIQLGYAVAIQPGTPLYDQKQHLGLLVSKNPVIWMNQNNPGLTYETRLQRRQQASELAQKLGYRMSFDNGVSLSEMQLNKQKFHNQIKLIEQASKSLVTAPTKV